VTRAIGAVLLLLLAGPVAANAAALEEDQVKAAFLFNFAKFVQWPGAADGPLVLCVAADERLAELLETTVKGRTFSGRAFVVRALRYTDDPAGCHLLYIAPARQNEDSDMFHRTIAPTLTVGETVRFLRDGGMIRLFLTDNRLQFQINAKAATAAGLKIHSQLLSLAAR
jgi:hypothetical protein